MNSKWYFRNIKDAEVVTQSCSIKKVFLEISQNSQENICACVSFLRKLQAGYWRPATLLKIDSDTSVFLRISHKF